MKLLFAALISIGILIGTIIYSDRKPQPEIPKFANQIHPMEVPPVYNPDDISQLTWSIGKDFLKIQRLGENWNKMAGVPFISSIDQWATQRRLVVFSHLPVTPGVMVGEPVGKIEMSVLKEKIVGVYDHQSFQWLSGPQKEKGIHIAQNNDIRELFSEGLWGFHPHKIELCKEHQIKKITFVDWAIERGSGERFSGEKTSESKWSVIEKDKKDKMRADAITPLLEKICHVTVDSFAMIPEPGTSTVVLKIESSSPAVEVKKFADTFSSKGFQFFKSRSLADTLTLTHPSDVRDPTLDEAKTAVDRHQSQEDRLKAIRKLRGNKSPESIAALKAIIFENTDIDLYRYEAVDSLQNIGTKDAYKVIIERLPQVGRSGFELRMARALAAAMGRFFKSDEKTPEDIRRPEVDELVQAAQKSPPGK